MEETTARDRNHLSTAHEYLASIGKANETSTGLLSPVGNSRYDEAYGPSSALSTELNYTQPRLKQATLNASSYPEYSEDTTQVMMMFSDASIMGSQYWSIPSSMPNFNDTNTTMSPEKCDELFEQFRTESGLQFTHPQLVSVAVTWAVFLLSAIGNLFVLSSVTFRRRRKHMSHSQLMMMHLTFANLAFTFFILPFDAIWRTTLEWKGGDFLCRLMNVLKQFAMYISSAMIVVMGIDRVASLMCPSSLAMQRQRIQKMLAIAWSFSFLNAIPAGVIFSVMNYAPSPKLCPEWMITQCVDLEIQERANLQPYYVYTMFVSFFGPLICILICYIFIAVSISRMARMSKEAQRRCSLKNRSSKKSVTRRSLDRARRVSQVVTGLITTVFILCWGPYYVVGLIHWFDENNNMGPERPEKRLTQMAQDIMLMSMYLNPCLHPLITVLLMKEVRDNILTQCRRSTSKGRLPPRKQSPKKQKIVAVVRDDKNGTKELLPRQNGRNGETDMHWV